MVISKSTTVNKKGMITIPANLRKKYNLTEGAEVIVLEIDGTMTIIPIQEIESLRITPRDALIKSIEQSRSKELELEK